MPAPEKSPLPALSIRPLRQPARFLDLQRQFYQDDPHFVPPMTFSERWSVDPQKNPFFAHAEVELLAAYRGNRAVGRISVARDRLHDEFHGDRVGCFGHFEAADENTAHALLAAAATWCKAHGATALRGPIDFSTNYRCGLLIEGTLGAPVMMMPHNPPTYAAWFAAFGLHKAKDLLALWVDGKELDRERMDRIADRVRQKSRAVLRRIDLKHFDQEMAILWDLYNRIWERNWGFVPMTHAEFAAQAKDLKQVAHPSLMHIAEIAGAPVGFIVALPDVNQAIRACNGRLLPFGWWKFLRTLRKVDSVRVITLGVVPEHRKQGIEMLMMHAVMRQGMDSGFTRGEASWILEDNLDMLNPLQALGYAPYRRYRIYEKALH
ncbi:hypothetical protein LBMAG49_29370 [Planctomycetota bacterium]|nr:hypothetical protein LBMAG49_29370 [Planctomycetota bacterium]